MSEVSDKSLILSSLLLEREVGVVFAIQGSLRNPDAASRAVGLALGGNPQAQVLRCAVHRDGGRCVGQHEIAHEVGSLVVLEVAARRAVPEAARLAIERNLAVGLDEVNALAGRRLLAFGQQFLPGLVKLGHEGGHVDGAQAQSTCAAGHRP